MTDTQRTQAAAEQLKLSPLPYHQSIRDYLKREQREVWDWYASHRVQDDRADAVRFELLKSTYRVDRQTQADLYELAKGVARCLGLDVPITIYQAQNPHGLNASLAYLPDEAHIVFHGSIASKLTVDEMRALLGHELSHLLLWQEWDGDYLIVDQVLSALTHDPQADIPHLESARLFRLYSEIFCDRGSLAVVDDPAVVVSMLVKVMTEQDEVSAESYLRQAEEIFRKSSPTADQVTHPEAFIRARAIQLWSDADREADAKISRMIEGAPSFRRLDFLAQERIVAATRRMLDVLLAPRWMQTDAVLAHARLFFHDYVAPTGSLDDASWAAEFNVADETIRDYFCYILLDFVTSDRDLEEFPLAAALLQSEKLDIKQRFMELARKELRMRKKQIDKVDQSKHDLLAKADKALTTS